VPSPQPGCTRTETGASSKRISFFSTRYPWGVFTSCSAGNGTYEVGNIAAHEVGHVLGLDHLSDSGKKATLYPSAPVNEVLKRTLTSGDKAGFREALTGR
jgi:hypothetical protein